MRAMVFRTTVVLLVISVVTGCSRTTNDLLDPGEKVIGRTRDDGRVRLLTTKHD